MSQGRGKHGVQKTGTRTEERGKGCPQHDKGRSPYESPAPGTAGSRPDAAVRATDRNALRFLKLMNQKTAV